MTKNSIARMTIDMTREDHKKLKVVAVTLEKSMREIVLEAINQYVQSNSTAKLDCACSKDPNATMEIV